MLPLVAILIVSCSVIVSSSSSSMQLREKFIYVLHRTYTHPSEDFLGDPTPLDQNYFVKVSGRGEQNLMSDHKSAYPKLKDIMLL